jgi:aspartate racemase
MAEEIKAATAIPRLHIADATAEAVRTEEITKMGLLGTRFTMEGSFYRERLQNKHGLEIAIPNKEDREDVHRIIYQELVQGQTLNSSRKIYQRMINRLNIQGAQGVILGCT